MSLLDGHRVLALGAMAQSPLARFFASLGATVIPAAIADLESGIADASFLIDDLGLPVLSDQGWTLDRIERRAARLVHGSVTTFGSDGPRGRWSGNELIASAMGGVLRLTGTPDRAPVKEALDACTFHAQMAAAAGLLAAHHERSLDGRGQHVDVSVQEVALSRLVNSALMWQFDRRKLARIGNALNYGSATVRCIWRLADCWCFHTLMTGRFGAPANRALSDWIDAVGAPNPLRGVDWLKYNRSTLDPATRRDWERALDGFFAERTKSEIKDEGRRRGINAAVVADPHDVLEDPHLRFRSFWQDAQLADRPPGPARAIRVPGRFLTVTEGPAARAGLSTRARGSRPGPLSGVRVLDFSWALVGSITTKILGDLGADVVKVESRTRPCLSRIDVQVRASSAGNFDDKPWFAHLNTSKRSLALDMKRPESRELIDPLLQWADVVVENFSPGTMHKLGLGYEAIAAKNPRLIMASGSVYGQTGPLTAEWGVDGTGAALSARTYLTGWPDRDPVIPGAVPYGDVIVPYVMAAGICAALEKRRASGVGVHLDVAMYEVCVQQMYEAMREAQGGAVPRRRGNEDPGVFHQGVYPTIGEDRWVAISIRDGAQWARLRALAGLPDCADSDERNAAIASWSSTLADTDVMSRLQQAGLDAGVVQDIEDLLERDPQIAARGSLVRIDHALLGSFGHLRTPLTFSRCRPIPYRSPSIGEHSAEIARSVCGLEERRIDELNAAGVFT